LPFYAKFYAKKEAAVPELDQDLYYHLLAYAIVGGAAASIALGSWVVSRRRLLPLQRARRADWDGGQVIFAFIVMMFVPPMVEGGLLARGFFQLVYGQEPSPTRQHLWANLIAFPLIVAGILVSLYLLRGTRPSDLGITRARLLSNLTLGALAWFPLTFFTLAVHFLALQLIEAEAHPLVKLAKEGMLPWEWALLGVEALAAAPFLEELLFRGVLQGWLVHRSRAGHIVVMAASVLFAGLSYFSPAPNKEPESAPLIFALCLVPGYLFILFRFGPTDLLPFRESQPPSAEASESIRAGQPLGFFSEALRAEDMRFGALAMEGLRTRRFPLPAIFGSSVLWAVFHSSVWPSPIPLFLLGLGLGWLAYRTQSLVAPLLVHMLFNGVAFLVLAMQS
jgi:membrane protease YdiL (CAAX protease family)